MEKAPLLRANPTQYNRVRSEIRKLQAQQKSEEVADRIAQLQKDANEPALLNKARLASINKRINALLATPDLSTEQTAAIGALRNTLNTNQVAALERAFADLQAQPLAGSELFNTVRSGVNRLKGIETLTDAQKGTIESIEQELDAPAA
ncbi:hypothetical protein RZS08_27275, partial [Arthrospira platensis SPKY1]|nr:hypothetical protein [Arthrospira platensis SPKY1]